MSEEVKPQDVQFFDELLRVPGMIDKDSVLEALISVGRKLKYSLPIRGILQVRAQIYKEAREDSGSLPFGEDGKWLTLGNMVDFGLGNSVKIEKVILERPLSFKSQVREESHIKAKEYFINDSNLELFDKLDDKRFGRVIHNMRNLRACRDRVKRLSAILAEVEGKTVDEIYSEIGFSFQESGPSNAVIETVPSETKGQEVKPKRSEIVYAPPRVLNEEVHGGQRGIWLTVKQIKGVGSEYSLGYINIILNRNRKDLSVREAKEHASRGKTPNEIFVTRLNYKEFGLSSYPIKQGDTSHSTKQKSDRLGNGDHMEFNINGQIESIDMDFSYGIAHIAPILKRVHSGVFRDQLIEKAVAYMDSDGDKVVSGKDLAKFLGKVNGMMLLSSNSTQKKLFEELGIPFEHLGEVIERYGLQRFIHRELVDVVGEAYILSYQLGPFRHALEEGRSLEQRTR